MDFPHQGTEKVYVRKIVQIVQEGNALAELVVEDDVTFSHKDGKKAKERKNSEEKRRSAEQRERIKGNRKKSREERRGQKRHEKEKGKERNTKTGEEKKVDREERSLEDREEEEEDKNDKEEDLRSDKRRSGRPEREPFTHFFSLPLHTAEFKERSTEVMVCFVIIFNNNLRVESNFRQN